MEPFYAYVIQVYGMNLLEIISGKGEICKGGIKESMLYDHVKRIFYQQTQYHNA